MKQQYQFLKRKEIRALKRLVRRGDSNAALRLLEHSVRCGHKRLALRRLFVALALGSDEARQYIGYCNEVSLEFGPEALRALRESAVSDLFTVRSNDCAKMKTAAG
ncbi:hypothetical protein [Notoacmeibacter sp. MSK16QG-6]|uniref:hypothetical protein n=1 Tax=Notoacmeibacter sp. MSK16QG-6 TaxID=2957982 RepID=UPI00209E20BC|nr:hypothetical protein [Notoacmeibacter sp. MSK16QG-6]MCP1199509.1 hypothetical protein [Notoacmeibacter sp. MSK16QG-6]